MIWVSANLNWNPKSWNSIVASDGKGYYAYLPATFIYQDLNFGHFEEMEQGKYYTPNYFYDYRRGEKGKYVNKYFCGVAFLQTPFYLLGHVWAGLSGTETDGYARPYVQAVHIGTICYLVLGMIFLMKLLALYQVSSLHQVWVVLVFTFATNLNMYVVEEPMMSHVFNFSLITLFLYACKRFFLYEESGSFLWAAWFFGVILILRPVNGLILGFLPFLAGGMGPLWKSIQHISWANWLGAVGLVGGMISVQLGIYYIQTGNILVYSYPDEGFNFLNPHFWQSLWSYKKGLFVYTPVLLLAYFLGSFYLWEERRVEWLSWTLFFVLLMYILSCWSNWYYGGSFGYRPVIDYYACFAILLGLGLKGLSQNWQRWLVFVMLFAALAVNQIQMYQYRHQVIPYEGMTKEMYWDNFLRIDRLIGK